MLDIRASDQLPIIETLTKEACDGELYLPGGIIQTWYQNPHKIAAISVAYIREGPAGASVILNIDLSRSWMINVGIYVKPKYRRNKIGTKLMKAVRDLDDRLLYACKNSPERQRFYGSLEL